MVQQRDEMEEGANDDSVRLVVGPTSAHTRGGGREGNS